MRPTAYLLLAFASVLYGCSDSAKWHYASGATWGTAYNIKYLADRDLADSIVLQMQIIDSSLSPFNAESLISHINSGEDVPCDSLFTDVFLLSQQVCQLSGGLFDPTVAPLINLWGFGYKDGATDQPSPSQIDSALMHVGIMDCSIDSDGTLKRKTPRTEFNFSAVAKGYGVDRVAEMLRRNGCHDYMVEIGGEIALMGDGPSGDGWRIQVDAPVSDSYAHKQFEVLHITDACIATSGNYRNHRTTSAGVVGHTISPLTGYPELTNTLSATIIAPSTALADALATAAMAMPDSAAMQMLGNIDGVGALLILAGDSTDYSVVTNPGFDLYMK